MPPRKKKRRKVKSSTGNEDEERRTAAAPRAILSVITGAGTTGSIGTDIGNSASASNPYLESSSAKIQSPSKSSNTENGFKQMGIYLRSVLIHPICFPLLYYLNDISLSNDTKSEDDTILYDFIQKSLSDFSEKDHKVAKKARENVFAATALDWNGMEKDLTTKLLYNINHCQIGNPLVVTNGEEEVKGENNRKGKVDLMFLGNEIASDSTTGSTSTSNEDGKSLRNDGEKPFSSDDDKAFIINDGESHNVDDVKPSIKSDVKLSNNTSPPVVAMFEFGIGNDIWWTKQDQILKYLQMLQVKNDERIQIGQPILISVITINAKESKVTDREVEAWSKKDSQLSDDDKISTLIKNLEDVAAKRKSEKKDESFVARFGVFLCIPKTNNEFRIALLWRHDTKTLLNASSQFGKILYAVQLCAYLRQSCILKDITTQYKYLGPNCCKIGKRVSWTWSHCVHYNMNSSLKQCIAHLYCFVSLSCSLTKCTYRSCTARMIIVFDLPIDVRTYIWIQTLELTVQKLRLPRLL
jgi:hypothetical protein